MIKNLLAREELMSFLSNMDYSISQVNPHDLNLEGELEVADIDGFGNYDLKVHGATSSFFANNGVLNLYFLDSRDKITVDTIRRYDWIKESQLHWLHTVSERVLDVNVPALTFFHIPIPDVRQLWWKPIVGVFQEAVASPIYNSGVLQTLVSMGNVKGEFLGHDHLNDFCGQLEGTWFCHGSGFGYHGYGKVGWHRRARVIMAELDQGESNWLGVERIDMETFG